MIWAVGEGLTGLSAQPAIDPPLVSQCVTYSNGPQPVKLIHLIPDAPCIEYSPTKLGNF